MAIKPPRMIVENMTSSRGNFVPNQFIIHTKDGRYFQSYRSTIAFMPWGGGKVVLDENTWDYSRTTGKYRNMFLNENTYETRKKIKSGEYLLSNLNSRS